MALLFGAAGYAWYTAYRARRVADEEANNNNHLPPPSPPPRNPDRPSDPINIAGSSRHPQPDYGTFSTNPTPVNNVPYADGVAPNYDYDPNPIPSPPSNTPASLAPPFPLTAVSPSPGTETGSSLATAVPPLPSQPRPSFGPLPFPVSPSSLSQETQTEGSQERYVSQFQSQPPSEGLGAHPSSSETGSETEQPQPGCRPPTGHNGRQQSPPGGAGSKVCTSNEHCPYRRQPFRESERHIPIMTEDVESRVRTFNGDCSHRIQANTEKEHYSPSVMRNRK
ncbi:hypothetical protein CSOJ01_04802 [Colletotrichum sojae]|uniref:Uncharacterized protein n=1 Tax=Colletotrichum sojae TaxID=2175907 RepID=A0A8H6JI75_9PEZI|nr:hypothetical protein CSOJ01_04802 [Colletotrichum sojae]